MGGQGHWILVVIALIFIKSIDAQWNMSCPGHCACEDIVCPKEFLSVCRLYGQKWTQVNCDNLNEKAILDLPSDTNCLSVAEETSGLILSALLRHLPNLRALSVKLVNFDLQFEDENELFHSVLYLNLQGGTLEEFPSELGRFPQLESLNLSENSLSGHLSVNLSSTSLKTLDLSQNRLDSVSLQGVSSLHVLSVQGNVLKTLPKIESSPNLELLNASRNLISFDAKGTDPSFVPSCERLPPGLKVLVLRHNLVKSIKAGDCVLLTGLHYLKDLDLGYNLLHYVPEDDEFGDSVAKTLESLKLDGNSIFFLRRNSFGNFKNLQYLSLSHNYIRSVPVELFQSLYHRSLYSNETKSMITLDKNPISCDCTERSLFQYLNAIRNTTNLEKPEITCLYPASLSGRKLIDLDEEDLVCTGIFLQQSANATCKEHHSCKMSCLFSGLPHPQVHWLSPEGDMISVETLAEDSTLRATYSLSQDGQQLSISSLEMQLTGLYKCFANNSLDSAESLAQVGLLPDPVGSIVAIAVSAVSFAIAIAVNCINMCKCYCENLDVTKEEHEEEELKMESPMKSKLKGLHESEASLNANKYYRKYDFACQHIFLDAVIRGAHTVKQTLYDAKNSEFSNNVWEYASHLRDRLHIELPSSVQFPRVSMPSINLPSISMPTISMPSMPNLQSINTNIERLGTSVISRSQNLATSVGSVFTLRWLRYGNSDNDSDSDVESSTVSQVQAHVHKPSVEDQESSADSSPTMYSRGFSKKFIPKAVWSRKPASNQCSTGTSRDSYATPERSKSVRFGNVETIKITRSSSCCELPSDVTAATVKDEDSVEQAHDIVVDMPEMKQFETSV